MSAAWPSFTAAWNSPSAATILARRSRSASASFAIARCILSGSTMSLISTAVTCVPQGSVCPSMAGGEDDLRLGQPLRLSTFLSPAGPMASTIVARRERLHCGDQQGFEVMESLPVIDIAALIEDGTAGARGAAARAIELACRDSGFFYVRNHGVSDAIIARLDAESRRF